MKIRQLFSMSALYGVADMLVMGVGGFLLLPLYTRTLSLEDFGLYIITKTNSEILGYLLYLGLLSAVARLFFDFRNAGREKAYINSVLMVFALNIAVAVLFLALFGTPVWRSLSPAAPVQPYIWYCLALAVFSFTAGLGALWYRLDGRAGAFAILQIFSSAVLVFAAYLLLVVFKLGLTGLLTVLIIGFLPGTAVLLWRLGRSFGPMAPRVPMSGSIHYGLPFAVGYVAYFILNRFSLLTLQHYVPASEIAIFGLAQQLAMLISIMAASFGKALQPAVYGADADKAVDLLRRASKVFIVVVFGAAGLVVLYAHEIVSVVAPARYLAGYEVLLMLLVGSFVYALSLVSATTIEYFRKPRWSAMVVVFGAITSVILGLILVPRYHLIGAAIATLTSYIAATSFSFFLAYRLSRQSFVVPVLAASFGIAALAWVSAWQEWTAAGLLIAIPAKFLVFVAVFSASVFFFLPKGTLRSWLNFFVRSSAN